MKKIPIVFGMATIPQRIKSLEETVNSILPQCDQLNIYLNNFGDKPTPLFLKNRKINVFRSEDEAGDIGDVGKFYCCEEWKDCYAFTIDDKYIYPSDYTHRLIETIEKYGRKAVISCHGRLIKPNCNSYYKDPAKMFCLGGFVEYDTFAHELGTGCMAFHTDTFSIRLDIFNLSNVSDILVSLALQRAKIPILIMKHKAGWVKTSNKLNQVYAIHNFLNTKDQLQTKLVNNFKWKINKCPMKEVH